MSDLTFSVYGESTSPAKFVAKTRGFTLIIDEPTDLGGSNEYANPVEYILAGLTGCLNVVGHLVAKELGFTIKNLRIQVSGTLNPNKLFSASNEERAGFKEINLELIPETDVDIETLANWLKIVEERCPVKDNLANRTPVNISVTKEYTTS